MAYREFLTLEHLNKLGITPDTNPNDPSTWSEGLKSRHSAVLSGLPEERRSKVKVKSSDAPAPEASEAGTEPITTGWLSRVQEESDRRVNSIDTSGDGPDGRPKEIDEASWGGLNEAQKSAIKSYVQDHREHVARWSRDNVPVDVSAESSTSGGWGGSVQWSDRISLTSGVRAIQKTFGYKDSWDLKKVKKKDRLSDEDQQAANTESIRKAYSLVKDYPLGFYQSDLERAGVVARESDSTPETTEPTPVIPSSVPAPSSQLDGSSNVGQQFKDLTSEDDEVTAQKWGMPPRTGPIVEPSEGSYANPWPAVRCAFCGDVMPGQHYAANHASESAVCLKARHADPRSNWAKSIGITPNFVAFDRGTWSKEVKQRSANYEAANGPVHPETDEAVHTGPTELTPRNPEYGDGDKEPTKEDVLQHWEDFRPDDLDFYMEKHGINGDELKPSGKYGNNEPAPEAVASSTSSEAQAEQAKAVGHLTDRLKSFNPKTTTHAVVKAALDRVQSGLAGSREEERGRITGILQDEMSKQKKGTIMHAHLELAARKYAEDTSEPEAPKEEPVVSPKPLTCTFCGETSSDPDSFKKDHQIVSNGWCKSVVDAHNSLNPKFPINVQ